MSIQITKDIILTHIQYERLLDPVLVCGFHFSRTIGGIIKSHVKLENSPKTSFILNECVYLCCIENSNSQFNKVLFSEAFKINRQALLPVLEDLKTYFDLQVAPEVVDHRNHITWDNRKANLRNCTEGENSRNRRKIVNAKSKYKGVTFIQYTRAHNGVWYSSIMYNGKTRSIGYFETEEMAAHAYNEEAIRLFGEFACLNDCVPTPAYETAIFEPKTCI